MCVSKPDQCVMKDTTVDTQDGVGCCSNMVQCYGGVWFGVFLFKALIGGDL